MNNVELDDQPLGEKGVTYVDKMDIIPLSRWYSLLMAVDEIENFCSLHNISCHEEMFKPIPIKHFIETKYPKILNDLKETK